MDIMKHVSIPSDVLKRSDYLDCYVSTDVNEASYLLRRVGLKFDYSDIHLDDAVKMKQYIGFVPMTKFRFYINGRASVLPELDLILKTLKIEHQNIAFINDMQTRYFVDISRRY
jgi:hypothetical protein